MILKTLMLLSTVLILCGCSGGGDITSPDSSEVTRYLDEHPEARVDIDPSDFSGK